MSVDVIAVITFHKDVAECSEIKSLAPFGPINYYHNALRRYFDALNDEGEGVLDHKILAVSNGHINGSLTYPDYRIEDAEKIHAAKTATPDNIIISISPQQCADAEQSLQKLMDCMPSIREFSQDRLVLNQLSDLLHTAFFEQFVRVTNPDFYKSIKEISEREASRETQMSLIEEGGT